MSCNVLKKLEKFAVENVILNGVSRAHAYELTFDALTIGSTTTSVMLLSSAKTK